MIKYADDTTLTGNIYSNDETHYRKEVDNFVHWCNQNFLVLNVEKTKEIIFDFRKVKTNIEPIIIQGTQVDMVTEYKYLGTYIDKDLKWNTNTQKLVSKANQRVFFIRKLKSFNVCNEILFLFYQSVIQSIVLSYCGIVWYSSLSLKNTKKNLSVSLRWYPK